MSSTLRRILLLFALFILVVFGVFLFNQTMQIVQSARAVNPTLGDGVLWGLIFLYAALLITPLVLWFRLPRRMSPPSTTEGAEYDRFMIDFRRRLRRNARLRDVSLETTEDVLAALKLLDRQADESITTSASTVFLSTAALQSGRLDVLVVLAAQTRLIWNVAHVYYQRPSVRDFLQLYANVATTAFLAAGVEDVDVDVLVSTIFGSSIAAIPGMHLLTNSVLSGSANAFLTLRVGMIAKEYCRCTVREEKRTIRRTATMQAARLLGTIVRDGTRKLSKAVVRTSAGKVTDTFNWITRRKTKSELEEP